MPILTTQPTDHQLIHSATRAAVVVAVTLILLKFVAYFLTNSVALLSTLVDSLLDLAASAVNMIAVKHALSPADQEHRFGHGKAESLAGLAQSMFILGSALFLLIAACDRLVTPHTLSKPEYGISVMFISMLLTFTLVQYQHYVVRKTGSLAISADSLHYVGDVLVNLSVIIALILAQMGYTKTDAIFAVLIALFIIYNAWEIAQKSLDQLMDRELPLADRAQIIALVKIHEEVIKLHDLRTRISGQTLFIQFHLELHGKISLQEAHRISDEVESMIRSVYPQAEIIIHEDPAGFHEQHQFSLHTNQDTP